MLVKILSSQLVIHIVKLTVTFKAKEKDKLQSSWATWSFVKQFTFKSPVTTMCELWSSLPKMLDRISENFLKYAFGYLYSVKTPLPHSASPLKSQIIKKSFLLHIATPPWLFSHLQKPETMKKPSILVIHCSSCVI